MLFDWKVNNKYQPKRSLWATLAEPGFLTGNIKYFTFFLPSIYPRHKTTSIIRNTAAEPLQNITSFYKALHYDLWGEKEWSKLEHVSYQGHRKKSSCALKPGLLWLRENFHKCWHDMEKNSMGSWGHLHYWVGSALKNLWNENRLKDEQWFWKNYHFYIRVFWNGGSPLRPSLAVWGGFRNDPWTSSLRNVQSQRISKKHSCLLWCFGKNLPLSVFLSKHWIKTSMIKAEF